MTQPVVGVRRCANEGAEAPRRSRELLAGVLAAAAGAAWTWATVTLAARWYWLVRSLWPSVPANIDEFPAWSRLLQAGVAHSSWLVVAVLVVWGIRTQRPAVPVGFAAGTVAYLVYLTLSAAAALRAFD